MKRAVTPVSDRPFHFIQDLDHARSDPVRAFCYCLSAQRIAYVETKQQTAVLVNTIVD